MFGKLMYRISFVLLFGLFAAGADAHLSSSLIAYYPLDGDATDASGNGHDGTIIGNPQSVPGKFGQALEFDGVDDYVQVADYIPISGAADRTVTAWVKMQATTVQGIVAWGVIQGQSKWVIRLTPKGQLRLEIEGDAIKGNTRLADGEWHHIAASFANDGTPALGDVNLYADGVLQNHADSPLQINTSDTGNLEIGRNLKNDGFFQGSIDEVKIYDCALSAEEILEDMEGPPSYSFADDPNPADGATDVQRRVVLSWTPLIYAGKHDVYLDTNFEDVSDADRANPLGVLVSQNQDPNSYAPPGLLDFGQTYYWRVDEVNAPPDLTVFKGNVWQFTVEPFAYPIKNISATASSSAPDRGPENTVGGSGLDESGLLHDKIADGTMWLSSLNAAPPTWIEYEFDKVYKLHEMWVWNFNDSLEPMYGFGFKDVTVEYSVNGIDYTPLGATHEFAQAPGLPDYAHNTIIDFGGVPAKHVSLMPNNNWGGILNQYGLSEVRFFFIPVQARQSYPASGTADVDINVTLSWIAGREAAMHDVYFSPDMQAVADGMALVSTETETNYGPLSLDLGTTYYWRVDEVNELEIPATWHGDIWSFSTQEYLVVDDFESYNDIEAGQEGSNLIYLTWADGFDNPSTNGSTIGYTEAFQPTMETQIVHGGKQSVPLMYNNSVASLSEVTANPFNLVIGRDWTIGSPQALVLWFYGDPANAITEQMYVKVNDEKVAYPGDAADVAEATWTSWTIDLEALGIDLRNVTQLSIGFERTSASGGSGTVLIDDIRLYRSAPEVVVPSE